MFESSRTDVVHKLITIAAEKRLLTMASLEICVTGYSKLQNIDLARKFFQMKNYVTSEVGEDDMRVAKGSV